MYSVKPAGYHIAFFVNFCLILSAVPSASAQTYTFSACSGLPIPGSPVYTGLKGTFTVAVTQVLFGGPVNVAGSSGYSYTVMANYTASTPEGYAKNFPGVQTAIVVTYVPGFGNAAGQTSFGVFLPAGGGTGSWAVNLLGDGNLMPGGISPLAPISSWVTANNGPKGDYIPVNTGVGPTLYYLIDTLGPCGSSGSGGNLKGLGDPADSPGACNCGDPISVGTGNLFEQVADYQTAGPNQLGFTRYYNSMSAPTTFAASLGANWRSTYDRYLRIGSATSVTAERADGQQLNFTLSGSAWTTDTDTDVKLTNSGTTWTLTDASDTVETYKTSSATEALLQTVRARNGYTQTLQYNGSNQLTAVTDSFQRQLSFTYSGGLLQSVTTPDGLVLTYDYTGSGAASQLASVSYSTSPVTSQTYLYENAALPNALTGIIDENGNRYATWTYDSKGRALTSQHAGGADLNQVAYNDTDGSRTLTSPLGAQTVYKFTTLQGVPKITEIDRVATATTTAAARKITYDSNGYMASQTDWNGNLTTYVNDVHGQPTSVVEASGTAQARTTTITYHPTFHLLAKIVQPGLTTSFTYDTNGELLTKIQADTTTSTVPYSTSGQTRTWTYTWSNFLPASVKTPRTDVNGVTTFTYDSSGALTGITNALGQKTQITQHLPGGLPQTVVDAERRHDSAHL